MKFVPTRQEDLRDLRNPVLTNCGVEVCDIMRFMNGDNPAAEMEDGTHHGGNYGCPGCDGNINSSHDLEYSLQRRYKTLSAKKKPYSLWACWKKRRFPSFQRHES